MTAGTHRGHPGVSQQCDGQGRCVWKRVAVLVLWSEELEFGPAGLSPLRLFGFRNISSF